MGSSVSKQDRDDSLLRCKHRLRHIQQAIDSRHTLSAAQLLYKQSLSNAGVALRQFMESCHDADPEKPRRSSCASLPAALPHPENATLTALLPEPRHSDVNHMRSAVITPLTVTVSPTEASFVKKEQSDSAFCPTSPLSPEFCSSWDFFDSSGVIQDETENTIALGRMEELSHPTGRDLATSVGKTSEITEVHEELGTPGMTEADGNDSHPKLNHNGCNEIVVADMHLPADSILEKEPDQVQVQVIERQNSQNSKPIGSNTKSEVLNVVERSYREGEEHKGSSANSGSKDFLSVVEELEHQFTRAAESCHEVSRMLETRKIPLSICSRIRGEGKSSDAPFLFPSLMWCKAGTSAASQESQQHITKVITWNSSLSSRSTSSKNQLLSAQDDADVLESCCDIVGEFCMVSGSHASSLDRLYAWEMKLYEELKATKSIEKIYGKKCAMLMHQFAKDVSAIQADKTRATVKDLHSQLVVRTEVLYSVSKTIEKLRDEELQPQLLELVHGLTRMWRTMQEIHQMQQKIVSLADTNFSSVSPPGELFKQTLTNLISEMDLLHCSLATWVDAYKCYVGGLNSWLQECVVQPRSRSRGRSLALSPRRHLAPPLFVLLGHLSAGIPSLPSEETCGSINNLASSLKIMLKHQAEGKPRRKKASHAELNTGQPIGEHDGKPEGIPKLAILKSGLITMFGQLSEFSTAMASLSENVKQETEAAQEAYTVGRLR